MNSKEINALADGITSLIEDQDATFATCFGALAQVIIALSIESVFLDDEELNEENLASALKAFAEFTDLTATGAIKALKEHAASLN